MQLAPRAGHHARPERHEPERDGAVRIGRPGVASADEVELLGRVGDEQADDRDYDDRECQRANHGRRPPAAERPEGEKREHAGIHRRSIGAIPRIRVLRRPRDRQVAPGGVAGEQQHGGGHDPRRPGGRRQRHHRDHQERHEEEADRVPRGRVEAGLVDRQEDREAERDDRNRQHRRDSQAQPVPRWPGIGRRPGQVDARALAMDANARHRPGYYGRRRITWAPRVKAHNLPDPQVACTVGRTRETDRLAGRLSCSGSDVTEFRPVPTVVFVQIASKAPVFAGVQ